MRPEKHCVLPLILTLLSCMIVSDTAKVSCILVVHNVIFKSRDTSI